MFLTLCLSLIALFKIGPELCSYLINSWYGKDLFLSIDNSELQSKAAEAINSTNYYWKAYSVILIFSLLDFFGYFMLFSLLLKLSLESLFKQEIMNYVIGVVSVLLTITSLYDIYLESLRWIKVMDDFFHILPTS